MAIAIIIATVLVLLTFRIHQATFMALASTIKTTGRSPHPRLQFLMLGIFVVHLVEILLYALGYFVAEDVFEIGSLEGERASGVLGLFYASAVFYTSLGLGDVLPNDHLRFIAGVEALNGLLLIAWSASFLFTVMERLGPALGSATRQADAQRDPKKSSRSSISHRLADDDADSSRRVFGNTE